MSLFARSLLVFSTLRLFHALPVNAGERPVTPVCADAGRKADGGVHMRRHLAHKAAADRAAGLVGDAQVNLPEVGRHLLEMHGEAFMGRFPFERGFAQGVANYALGVTKDKLSAAPRPPGARRAQALSDASYNLKWLLGVDRFDKDPEMKVLLARSLDAAK